MGKSSRAKRDRRFERNHPKPFRHMDIPTADTECGRKWDKKKAVLTTCAVCEMQVYLHCSDCNIQVTGCLCVAVERMSPEELQQFKEQIKRKRAQEAGIVLPFDN